MYQRLWQLSVVAIALGLLLTGCSSPATETAPEATAKAAVKPLDTSDIVIATAQRLQYADPASPSTKLGDLISLDVFQRLMVYRPDGTLLPDAAKDCAFTDVTVYECELRKNLKFQNGEPVTAGDVKFSIDRARKLKAPGTNNLKFLEKITTPDDHTIRFKLSNPDSEFGKFLAMPAASIVPAHLYSANALRKTTALPVGSGPFKLVSLNPYLARFVKNQEYQGATPASTEAVLVRILPNISDGELGLQSRAADIFWDALSTAAVTRFSDNKLEQINYKKIDTEANRYFRVDAAKVSDANVRAALNSAWQRDRTWLSILPPSYPGFASSFAAGGNPKPNSATAELTLSYDSGAVDAANIADQLAAQATRYSKIKIHVVANKADADLVLTDADVPLAEAFSWLSYYLEHASKAVGKYEIDARATIDTKVRDKAIEAIQQQAAKDLVELPIRELPNPIFIKSDISLDPKAVGPGNQFTLWGIHR